MSTVDNADGIVSVSPSTLRFNVELDKDLTKDLMIENKSSQTIAYKVKTTAPDRYQVRPIQALLAPGGKASCLIVMKKFAVMPDPSNPKEVRHKFLVQACLCDETVTDLPEFWKNAESRGLTIESHRIGSRLVVPSEEDSVGGPGGPAQVEGYENGDVANAIKQPLPTQGGDYSSAVPSSSVSSLGHNAAPSSTTASSAASSSHDVNAAMELAALKKQLDDKDTDYKGLLSYSVQQNIQLKELKAQLEALTEETKVLTCDRDQASKRAKDMASEFETLRKLESARKEEQTKKEEREMELSKTWPGKLQLPVQLLLWEIAAVALIAFLLGAIIF